jgi:hypothetical protein
MDEANHRLHQAPSPAQARTSEGQCGDLRHKRASIRPPLPTVTRTTCDATAHTSRHNGRQYLRQFEIAE